MVTEGYWKKEGSGKKTKVFDDNNKEIRLTPGQTFVTVIQPSMTVTYDEATTDSNSAQ